MKTDLITVWPKHIDYPLFRHRLKEWSKYFHTILIALVPGLPDRDVSTFLVNDLGGIENVKFVRPPSKREDWRDNAVIDLLAFSTAKRVLFIEQDFMIKDVKLFETILATNEPFIGFYEGERLHPAFALINRDTLNHTSFDFAARPPAHDHFGHVFNELKEMVPIKTLEEYGFEDKVDYCHMGGLTQNYMNWRESTPFYKPDEFITYNNCVTELSVLHDVEFLNLSLDIKRHYGIKNVEYIKRFFP